MSARFVCMLKCDRGPDVLVRLFTAYRIAGKDLLVELYRESGQSVNIEYCRVKSIA